MLSFIIASHLHLLNNWHSKIMAILKVSVVIVCNPSVKYSIFASESKRSFCHFFKQSIRPSTSIVPLVIVKVEVGTSKDKLDLVDLNLVIGRVVESFGRFVKYSVREKEHVTRNVLMDSQRSVQTTNCLIL